MRLLILLLAGILLPKTAFAANPYAEAFGYWSGPACTILPYCGAGLGAVAIVTGIVIKTILWAIGSAAVLIILYASIRLVTSGGNEEIVRKAWKETILYACLGLLFAVLSDVIVNYVISLVSGIAAS